MRVPVRFCPETALSGNTHLVKAPGGERGRKQGERERERQREREDVMSLAFLFFLTIQRTYEFTVLYAFIF